MNDSDTIIRVTDVWKKFTIQRGRAGDLRERFAAARAAKNQDASGAELWALKEISFSVAPGRSLGIVGHNGSGKSTLLKLLTGILQPTRGAVAMKGRVGALIEVGAGFHPDLSGRENIYLNGSILGLSRKEIDRKFDDIVSFAGLEQFIDTPVKRYSSGMYMRLGFAVAAHTDPDILLIDEVLAVGDTFFQRKCLRHLEDFVRRGGAVVFVSHAMSQVAELCETCLWLDHGELKYHGPTQEVIHQYMDLVREREEAELRRNHPEEWAMREAERQRQEEEARALRAIEEMRGADADKADLEAAAHEALWRDDPARGRFAGIVLRDTLGRIKTIFDIGETVRAEISYRFGRPLPAPVFCLEIYREDETYIFATNSLLHKMDARNLPPEGVIYMEIPNLSLNAGTYRVDLTLFPDGHDPEFYLKHRPEDKIKGAIEFAVHPGPYGGYGAAYIPVRWSVGQFVGQAAEEAGAGGGTQAGAVEVGHAREAGAV